MSCFARLKQNILSPLCLRCGSLQVEASLFCAHCYQLVIKDKINCTSSKSFERHYYLIEWNKNDAAYLNRLVYCLKSDNSVEAINFYTEKLYNKIKTKIEFQNFQALLPIPGSRPSSIHAELIAKALAPNSGLQVRQDVLVRQNSHEQKTLSAFERLKHTRFSLNEKHIEEFTNCRAKAKPFLLVDDVLTTGESFHQCAKLLSAANDTAIVSLFYRPKQLRVDQD